MKLIFGHEYLFESYEYMVENHILNNHNTSNVTSVTEDIAPRYNNQPTNTSLKLETVSSIVSEFKLKGIMLQSEVENRNGRKYKRHVIEREVSRYYNDVIKCDSGVGTLGHDDTPNIIEDRVSHKILELKMDGNNALGLAKITELLPMGRILVGFVKEKIRFGMSSRGVGDIDGNVVGDNYNLISIDAVLTPSAPQAYMESVIENKHYIVGNDGDYVEESINRLKQQAGSLSHSFDKTEIAKCSMGYLLQFIDSIKNNYNHNSKK